MSRSFHCQTQDLTDLPSLLVQFSFMIMLPLARRRSSPNRTAERRWLDELPEDVLILIFSQCRIDELFTLRLTSSRTRSLISEYIATIAPSVGRSTFPLNDLLLTPLENPTLYTINWLKGLIPLQLASILVDRHRFSHEWTEQRYGIPAEDPYGDVLRARVANGWRVLRRLSKISQDVYNLHPRSVVKSTTANLAWKVVHPSRYKFEVFREREDMILKRRLDYIKNLPDELAKDYKLMFMLLSSAFRTSVSNYGDDYKPWIFDWGCGIDGQRLLRRGNSWLTWFVLNEGPDLFWEQWWSLDPKTPSTKNHIRDRSIEAWFGTTKITPEDFVRQFLPKEWNDVNEKWHSIQRDYAFKVQKAIEEKAASASMDFTAVNPILYFTQYAECRQLRGESGIPSVKETLSQVPFHVDFRCPEELFQKFCLLRSERVVAMANRPRGEG
ncbi:uncharacterized protein BDR25DRAFT_306758 [Lindgomyces ingoldianus]|uniref:Uncharacterized protein n=1 Tax=Lindgomyces ingoldianus TaxID=673940 RepID=A0ACB6QED6_9PLEO|nr:uncharacterized protein BDR25DRAFT_306758 [Lindgomyces ingoldianus]KAF2465318.1 hypothetical protein BDR25DRAFT_306758 [Lindgomyces ingoldianus]